MKIQITNQKIFWTNNSIIKPASYYLSNWEDVVGANVNFNNGEFSDLIYKLPANESVNKQRYFRVLIGDKWFYLFVTNMKMINALNLTFNFSVDIDIWMTYGAQVIINLTQYKNKYMSNRGFGFAKYNAQIIDPKFKDEIVYEHLNYNINVPHTNNIYNFYDNNANYLKNINANIYSGNKAYVFKNNNGTYSLFPLLAKDNDNLIAKINGLTSQTNHSWQAVFAQQMSGFAHNDFYINANTIYNYKSDANTWANQIANMYNYLRNYKNANLKVSYITFRYEENGNNFYFNPPSSQYQNLNNYDLLDYLERISYFSSATYFTLGLKNNLVDTNFNYTYMNNVNFLSSKKLHLEFNIIDEAYYATGNEFYIYNNDNYLESYKISNINRFLGIYYVPNVFYFSNIIKNIVHNNNNLIYYNLDINGISFKLNLPDLNIFRPTAANVLEDGFSDEFSKSLYKINYFNNELNYANLNLTNNKLDVKYIFNNGAVLFYNPNFSSIANGILNLGGPLPSATDDYQLYVNSSLSSVNANLLAAKENQQLQNANLIANIYNNPTSIFNPSTFLNFAKNDLSYKQLNRNIEANYQDARRVNSVTFETSYNKDIANITLEDNVFGDNFDILKPNENSTNLLIKFFRHNGFYAPRLIDVTYLMFNARIILIEFIKDYNIDAVINDLCTFEQFKEVIQTMIYNQIIIVADENEMIKLN